MAPLCGYFTLYTTQQPHYLIQQKKPMPRKMIINQCSCPDSILLLFSCIHKFYETNIYKKKTQYKCPWHTKQEYRGIKGRLFYYSKYTVHREIFGPIAFVNSEQI